MIAKPVSTETAADLSSVTRPRDPLGTPHRNTLTILLLVALVLRLWGIWNAEHTDEFNEVFEALRVDSGHFNYERWGKRFYLYILAIEYALYYATGWIIGLFSSPIDFAEKIVRNMQPLFLMGRLTSTASAVASIFLVFKIGQRFYSKNIGLLAAFSLTVTTVHISVSQHARVDSTLLLLTLAAFYNILMISEAQANKSNNYFFAGLLIGLAFQVKAYAIVLVVPLFLAYLTAARTSQEPRKHRRTAIATIVGSFVIGSLLGNPPLLFGVHRFLHGLWALRKVYTEPINIVSSGDIGLIAYPIFFIHHMGLPLFALCLLGMIYASLKRSAADNLLLSFIIPFYVLIGSSRFMVAGHYLLPALPLLYLLGWRLIEHCIHAAPINHPRAKTLLTVLLLCIFLTIPFSTVLTYELSLTGKNSRHLAKQWIEEHVPPGSKILMDSGKSINSYSPPIAENNDSLKRILAKAEANISNGIIVHGMVDEPALLYYKLLLRTIPQKSYDITSTGSGLHLKDLDYYTQNGYQYLIISKAVAQTYLSEEGARLHPQSAQFYRTVFNSDRLALLKTISPSQFHRGDTYYIFRVSR